MAKTESYVCIDSMIFVWGIKKEATEGQESMIGVTAAFIDWLDINNKKIIIPAPVIAEVMSPIPITDERYSKILKLLENKFRIVPFDTAAALKCAEIINKTRSQSFIEEIPRRKLKFDSMIVAIAATRGVECLYSHDDGVHKFANGFVNTSLMPSIPVQTTLYNV